MTLDLKIKTMIAVGAIAFATAILPEQSYAQFAPTLLLEETRWDVGSVEKYTKIYDSLVKKYGTFLGKAAFRGFSRTELKTVESDISVLMSDPIFSKFPLQVSSAIIASANMGEIKGRINFANSIDDYLRENDPKYTSANSVSTIVDSLEILRECQDTKLDPDGIIDLFINYELIAGSLNPRDLVVAYALKNANTDETMKEIGDFGNMLMKDKKYSKELAGTVMISYARGGWKKDACVKLADSLIASKYSEKLIIGMMYAYGFGPHYSRFNDSEWMVFNDKDNLERMFTLMKGKYDDETIGILLECCSGTDFSPAYRKL